MLRSALFAFVTIFRVALYDPSQFTLSRNKRRPRNDSHNDAAMCAMCVMCDVRMWCQSNSLQTRKICRRKRVPKLLKRSVAVVTCDVVMCVCVCVVGALIFKYWAVNITLIRFCQRTPHNTSLQRRFQIRYRSGELGKKKIEPLTLEAHSEQSAKTIVSRLDKLFKRQLKAMHSGGSR